MNRYGLIKKQRLTIPECLELHVCVEILETKQENQITFDRYWFIVLNQPTFLFCFKELYFVPLMFLYSPPILLTAEHYTLFLKNSITFPQFNVVR